jgi:hypothetical protein
LTDGDDGVVGRNLAELVGREFNHVRFPVESSVPVEPKANSHRDLARVLPPSRDIPAPLHLGAQRIEFLLGHRHGATANCLANRDKRPGPYARRIMPEKRGNVGRVWVLGDLLGRG